RAARASAPASRRCPGQGGRVRRGTCLANRLRHARRRRRCVSLRFPPWESPLSGILRVSPGRRAAVNPRTMKLRTLAVLVVAAVIFLLLTGFAMPEQVASHFAGDGSANGVMPRSGYLGLMIGLTVA